jgi:hypothetical protein
MIEKGLIITGSYHQPVFRVDHSLTSSNESAKSLNRSRSFASRAGYAILLRLPPGDRDRFRVCPRSRVSEEVSIH